MPESAGQQFDVLTISFDPHETPELAAAKKQNYLKGYRRPRADAGWHFLTADADAIRALTGSLGFQYHWDVRTSSFAHPSMLAVLTPDGRISHYVLGTEFDTGELHDALLRAGPGRIGTPAPALFLYCLRYDPARGKYSLILSRAVQVGGLLTFISLASFIGLNFLKEHRRRVN
jgi:protein SCO1/2